MARPRTKKKYYSVEEANATLPLLRSILRDVTALAGELRGRHEHLARLQNAGKLDAAHEEEVQAHIAEFERGQERMKEYEAELGRLQIELKDYFTGLVDFRAVLDGREVYLCWRLGEPEVGHWHEVDAGFAGRKKLSAEEVHSN